MHRNIRIVFCILITLYCASSFNAAFARTYYVAVSGGSDGNSCASAQSVSTPKATVNAGISCMRGGDTLYIRSGNYNEFVYNVIPNGTSWPGGATTIAGYPGDPKPILNPTGSGTADLVLLIYDGQNIIWDGINMDGTNLVTQTTAIAYITSPRNVILRNFELYNAPANGLLMGDLGDHAISNMQFLNMKVHDIGIQGTIGHGFYLGAMQYPSSGVVIDGCEIYNVNGYGNSYGVQIYHYGGSGGNLRDFTVRNSYIHDNANGMVIGSGSNLKVYNNVFANNGAISSSGVPAIDVGYNATDNVQIYNNTLYNNVAPLWPNGGIGAIGNDGYGTVTNAKVQNNILWQNANHDQFAPLGTGATVSNNLQAVNPLFVNASAGDFHLTSSGPACNAGVNLSSLFTTDMGGSARPAGSAYDIGSYECVGVSSNAPDAPQNLHLVP